MTTGLLRKTARPAVKAILDIVIYRTTKTPGDFNLKDSLLKIFELEKKKSHDFKIHIGGMLSGGARMRSQTFLRELLVSVTNSEGPGGYVGGEMEGVGLLAVSDKANPVWIVVKGISDFADQNHAVEGNNIVN